MKFLLFLENDVSLDTGDGINERESLQALLRLCGDDLLVVLPKPARPDTFFDPRILYVPAHRVYKPLHYLRFLLASWWTIRQAVKKHQVAAIIHRPGATLMLPFLLSLGKTPVILKTLSAFNHMRKNEGSLLKRLTVRAYELIAPRFFRRCLGADVVSEHYVDWFSDRYGMNRMGLQAIFNGVNTNTFRVRDRDEAREYLGVSHFERVVGYIGAIHPMRELDVAITSLKHLSDMPGLGIVMVGEGPERSRLESLAKELDVADRIVFRSALPYTEMPRVINAFDVGIDLTKVEVHTPEGTKTASFSQKISQYLACGVPVIAWDTVDTKFLGENHLGAILQEATPQAVANALREVVGENCASRDELRRYGVEHLSADCVANKRLELWRQLVNTGVASVDQQQQATLHEKQIAA